MTNLSCWNATAMLGATLAEWQKKREEEAARLAAMRNSGGGEEGDSDAADKKRMKVLARVNPAYASALAKEQSTKAAIAKVTAQELKGTNISVAQAQARQQAQWDANGQAIYAANQQFKETYGKEMDAATKEQAIKDATVNGVFNAGLYSVNLNTAQTKLEQAAILEAQRQAAEEAARQQALEDFRVGERDAVAIAAEYERERTMQSYRAGEKVVIRDENNENFLSAIWNANMSAVGSALSLAVKNVAGLSSVNRDDPLEKEEGCGFLWYKCWLLPWIDSMKRPSTSAANATATSIAQSAQETAWAQITQTAQAILASTPLPQSTPTPILPDYQAYKLTGPLTEWEAEYGGQMAYNAHLLQPYFSNFEFWSEGIEINGDPPWAGQGDLKNMPIPMLYQNGKLSWYVINQGQIGVVNVPETDNWINNKFSSTREGAKPISQIFEYTNNKIPFVCGDVPDWQHFMVGHNLQLDFPKIAEQYPTGRWPRSAYGWVTLFFNAPSDFHYVDLRTINTNTYRFTNENLPELGDTIVTQFGDNVMSTSGEDATHVGSVVEIKGYGLEQIIVFEGNTGSNSLTFTTLKQFIEREGGQMKYILYGHPTLP